MGAKAFRMVDGCTAVIAAWDSAGQVDYVRLRPLSYPQTDIFVIAYSVDSRKSFEAVAQSWMPELLFHNTLGKNVQNVNSSHVRRGDAPEDGQIWGQPCAAANSPLHGTYAMPPVALLGLRTDRRDPANAEHVSTQEGLELARSIGACYFDECSAKLATHGKTWSDARGEHYDVSKIFDDCIRCAAAAKGRTCCNLQATLKPPSKTQAHKVARKHKALLRRLPALPDNWWTQLTLRQQGCRQRLAFASVLHDRLGPDSAFDAAAELPTDILGVIGVAVLRDHPFVTTAVQLRMTGDWLKSRSLCAEPEVEAGKSLPRTRASGCAWRPGNGDKACSIQQTYETHKTR